MKQNGIVIVGGGLAGQRCAETLRRRGYEGRLRVVCAEPEPPYDRPPLSKALLEGAVGDDDLAYRPAWWYEEKGVELLLAVRAERLNPTQRRLTVDSGAELSYEKLLIATGCSPRRLPFLASFENVHHLRSLGDARRLRSDLRAGSRLAVVGAGFIGQEVAATARRLGLEVTMIEARPSPLASILGPQVGGWFARLHREEGVDVITGAVLESAHGESRVEALTLAGGRTILCDAVVVGAGTLPATGWLVNSGLEADGVRTDGSGRTRVPGVFAAGDASIPFDPRFGMHARTEHWDAAAWHGAAAARSILGEEPGPPPLPSFWSDQYGLRIQYVGHAAKADAVVLEGEPAERDFEALFLRRRTLVAALTVGRPRAIPGLRKRIERGHAPATAREKEAA